MCCGFGKCPDTSFLKTVTRGITNGRVGVERPSTAIVQQGSYNAMTHLPKATPGELLNLAVPTRHAWTSVLQAHGLRIAFMTLTLFPIRLFFAAFMMLLAWPFAFIASMGSAERELEKPLSWWRKVVDFLLKAIMRTMWLAGGFHWINVKGRQALPAEAAILTLAPHSSYFDAIPVTMTMASIVMKAESKDIPVWGTLIKYIRPVFVSRSDQDSRRKTVEEIKRRAQSNGKWPQIMIFPEGTCTNRSCLITFKPGRVQHAVYCLFATFKTCLFYFLRLEILWLTLCQFHNFVEIEFLPVYIPSEEEKKNPSLYANNVRRVMADICLPADKCRLYFIMMYSKLLAKGGLRPILDLRDLNRFMEKSQFRMVSLVRIIPSLDLDGIIDLREYVTALSVVCRPSKTLETIQLAFKMYESQNGTIIENDLACILKTALGVSELNVTDLFKAIDAEEKGKITYDDFYRYTEMYPDFAEEYLYHDQMEVENCLKTSLPAPNGFCTDFSPENADDKKNPLQKKLN
uniref:Lysophosphatidylcholine acyltransferase 1 n=1 Tax=Chelydra serpentina TaxID=8475 RepID=A0A8C3TCT5_CHESE